MCGWCRLLGLGFLVCSVLELVFLSPEGQGHLPAPRHPYPTSSQWCPDTLQLLYSFQGLVSFLFGEYRGQGRPESRDLFPPALGLRFFPFLGHGGCLLPMSFLLATRQDGMESGGGHWSLSCRISRFMGCLQAPAFDTPSPEAQPETGVAA